MGPAELTVSLSLRNPAGEHSFSSSPSNSDKGSLPPTQFHLSAALWLLGNISVRDGSSGRRYGQSLFLDAGAEVSQPTAAGA